VDVLAQFRPVGGQSQNPYAADYAALKGLQELASKHNLAIIVVHHVRKAKSDVDPFETISGTMGLTGAADTCMVLDGDGDGITLYARGRDIEEYDKAIVFNTSNCRWTVQGDASEVRRSDERGKILAVLEGADAPMAPKAIQAETCMKRNNVDQLLRNMTIAHEVLKSERGRYVHPANSHLMPDMGVDPNKIDKKVRNHGGDDANDGDEADDE
jgi:hypothetical protein